LNRGRAYIVLQILDLLLDGAGVTTARRPARLKFM